jgi:RNA polymerase sigma factor (sigma-70 family)
MANDTLSLFLHQLNLSADAARWETSSDGDLLEGYSRHGAEAAFAELMRRHGPMVLAVCRRVLGPSPDAEDAFQATFAVLASRAGTLRRAPVGGWLHRVAVRAAGKLRLGTARRQALLRKAPPRSPARLNPEASWEEVKPILDEELERLPERARRLLVLCYLEEKTHVQAAAELGLPVGSMARHLEQARELLRRRLVRRGVTVPAVLLGVLLAETAPGAGVPAVLLVHTLAAVRAVAAGSPQALPPRVAAVVQGVLPTLMRSHTMRALVLVLALTCAGVGLCTYLAKSNGSKDALPVALTATDGNTPARATGIDRQGDPLPRGALARLGSVRWRHGQFVTFVAFVAGGQELLTVGQDGIARQWDAGTGREVRHFTLAAASGDYPTGLHPVSSVALSADGKVLVSSNDDGVFRVWDAAVGQELRQIQPPPDGFLEIALSPDGKVLAVLEPDHTIPLYEVSTGKVLRRLGRKPEIPRGRQGPPPVDGAHLAFAPDSRTLVSSAPDEDQEADAALMVWDTATGKRLRVIADPEAASGVQTPTFSPDGKLLAWRRGDGTIQLADAATGKPFRRFPSRGQEQDHGIRFAFTPDSKTLVARSPSDQTLWMWDVATGKQRRRFPGTASGGFFWRNANGNASEGMALASDGKHLALVSDSHAVRLLDLTTGASHDAGSGHSCGVAMVRFAPAGKTLTSYGEDGTLRVWDAGTGQERRHFELPEQTHFRALSADGRTVALTHWDNTVTLRDVVTGKERHRFGEPKNGIAAVAFSPDDRTLAVLGLTGSIVSIWLYDAATAREIRRISVAAPDPGGAVALPDPVVTGMVFSPDGATLAAPISPSMLGLWDAASGRVLHSLRAPGQRAIRGAVFTPDGRSLVVDLGDDVLSLWEVATGKERIRYGKKLRPHGPPPSGEPIVGGGLGLGLLLTRPAPGIAVSPDGRLLAQAGLDGVVRVWETASGREVGQFKGHRGRVATLAFAPDGKTLASGSADTTALIWDVAGLKAGTEGGGK